MIRVLVIADTHLGFDLPMHPRIERRRRGEDFFANFERALAPAIRGQVDLVVHGGDVFFRSRVPPAIIEMAMAPLARVAEHGVPVFIVPGNHERAQLPLHLWAAHPNIMVFDVPRTFLTTVRGSPIAVSGFPFTRRIRDAYAGLVAATRYQEHDAVVRLLCMHQTIEGAQVGPSGFTFRRGPDVISGSQLSGDFDALLCGHIHRAQVLTHDLSGRRLAAPVIIPGAIERTSFAERNETKSYAICSFSTHGSNGGRLADVSVIALPARPMVNLLVEYPDPTGLPLAELLERRFRELDPDAVVRIQINGTLSERDNELLSAAFLRSLAPTTMNVTLARPRPENG